MPILEQKQTKKKNNRIKKKRLAFLYVLWYNFKDYVRGGLK